MTEHLLLGDLSGHGDVKLVMTSPGRRLGPAISYPCHSLEELSAAVSGFLETCGRPELKAAAFAACGWEVDGGFTMPNHGFRLEREWLRSILGVQRLHMVNDCVSEAMAIAKLESEDLIHICGPASDDSLSRAFVGPNIGLGTAAVVADDFGNTTVVPCEGGHTDLAAINELEHSVLGLMIRKYGHVSRERAVSLPGLSEIWRCLSLIDGEDTPHAEPEHVVTMAHSGNVRARKTVDLCVGWLAATASDTALMTGARDGVYLSGALIDLLGDLIDKARFAERFCDKGRLRGYLEHIPVYFMKLKEPELLGLSSLFA